MTEHQPMWRNWQLGASIVLAAAALGCRSNPNYCPDEPGNRCRMDPEDANVVDTELSEGLDVPDAASYRPAAVRFEGDDYLKTGSLTNTTASARGVYSVWLRFTAGDSAVQQITPVEKFTFFTGGVTRTSNNRFQFHMPSCVNAPRLTMSTANEYTIASGWVHLLASWDTSASRADIYINDVHDVVVTSLNAGDICYTADEWGTGGLSSGALDADVADLYFAAGAYLDITDETVRRKFRDAAGKPVDLGTGCGQPTGLSANLCMQGATWNVNKGTGGGMVVSGGALSPAPTNPAD